MSDKILNHNGYCGTIEIDIGHNRLFGSVLFINDVVAYKGDTPAELKAAFEQAVDRYLEKCAKKNVSPDKPFNGSFNVRFPPELHRMAALTAARSSRSLNDFVRECVQNGVDQH
jgi:predicted HicB family RNase H-like nuclease